MTEQNFIKINSNIWRQLEDFSVTINKKGIRALNSKQIKLFLHAFRQASHHLAYARTHYPASNTVSYLNALITKCHSYVYGVKKVSLASLALYVKYKFPALIKQYKWFVLSAFGVFMFGYILSLMLVAYNMDNARFFLPTEIINNLKQAKIGRSQWNSPLMSSYIMTNNITVAFKAFALGITLGIGTLYVLFFNGAMLGALTYITFTYSNMLRFWSLILPHGIIELTAIFIASAAGFVIARSILFPGEHSRLHALIKGSTQAVSLIGGVIMMLIIAGIIEGFFTPLNISAVFKLLFAGLTGILLIIYFAIPYIIREKTLEE